MSNGITQENMLSVLPGVLARDDGMFSLAKLIAWIFGADSGKVNAPAVFQNISSLDEGLLDILAKDLKVDWYDYDADVATKRKQIKSNWKVRDGLGTVAAVKTALQDVWPESTVEEWFDYGGDPGYFRVILGYDSGGTIDFDKAVRMINVFKPVRAHIDGQPIIRIECGIVIETGKFSHKYHPGRCGTLPRRKSYGGKEDDGLIIGTGSLTQTYRVKPCGTPLGALM